MKLHNKIILITAGAAVAAGTVICAVALSMGAMSSAGLHQNSQTINEKITSMDIDLLYDDVIIVPEAADHITIGYTTGETKQYDIKAEKGVLSIHAKDTHKFLKWYEYIKLDFRKKDKNTVYIAVPYEFTADIRITNNYGDISISEVNGNLNAELNCGNLKIQDGSFSSLESEVDLGDTEISSVRADSITVNNDCGDIKLSDVKGNISAHCDLGDIEFENISGDGLIFENNCGDIEGNILGSRDEYSPNGSKKLEAKTDLGDVDIKFKQKMEAKQ